ncbi:nucleolar protein 58-like [Stegodyphus dumicola]|uniref:nucleolar protein 58-like n=1 Tax=Stegodyphus dumicola TaxID=202533 RepID=UPI0015AF9603|nr:nucleolar protein 58-like [Stegodyphus dumicola]
MNSSTVVLLLTVFLVALSISTSVVNAGEEKEEKESKESGEKKEEKKEEKEGKEGKEERKEARKVEKKTLKEEPCQCIAPVPFPLSSH